ncbi:TetR/AcrR family transcriptional regulator [Actinoalloteichus spitiensis]|uniref:TetR/AcrR family transcriptional regulator n=1 Tax=Actinoalloteichus spitiensis TaxID=252394 RepID=UPI00037F704F|nr:TetR/AcrR family transcriptional regulator [Actinoalloteichus spitiensis]
MRRTGQRNGVGARERILTAAGELFAESGFDATPTSRIAERAEVPKGLVHYYFRRKQDLLAALIERLPDVRVDLTSVVVPGDVATSLRQLVAALDRGLDASPLLSHLLWRETDTHPAVRDALDARLRGIVAQIREVLIAARRVPAVTTTEAALVGDPSAGAGEGYDDIESAAALLALAVSYRHSVARHTQPADVLDRELEFVARALETR